MKALRALGSLVMGLMSAFNLVAGVLLLFGFVSPPRPATVAAVAYIALGIAMTALLDSDKKS